MSEQNRAALLPLLRLPEDASSPLGVFIRPSVETPVVSGFLAFFASVQIDLDGRKNR